MVHIVSYILFIYLGMYQVLSVLCDVIISK